jgi:hypothetical protein
MSTHLGAAKQVATKAVKKADKVLQMITGTLRNKADTSPREYQAMITAHRATLEEVIDKLTHLHQELKIRIDNDQVAIDKPLANSWSAKYRDHLRQLNINHWIATSRATLQAIDGEIASAEEAERSERNRTKRSEELMMTAIELSTRSFRGTSTPHAQRTSTPIVSDEESEPSLIQDRVGSEPSIQESDQSVEETTDLDRFYDLDMSSEDEDPSTEMSHLALSSRGRPSSSYQPEQVRRPTRPHGGANSTVNKEIKNRNLKFDYQPRYVEHHRSSGPPPPPSRAKPVKSAPHSSRIPRNSASALKWNESDSDSDHQIQSDESQNHPPPPNYSFSSDSSASEPSANQKLKESKFREKKLKMKLKAEKEKRLQLEKRDPRSLDSERVSSFSKSTSMQIQRPSVKLPSFSGNQNEFSQFSKTFRVMVGESHQLSNIEKLIYLRQALSGAAFKTIQRIEISDGGYQTAWSKLDRRYGDAGQVKDALMRRFEKATVTKTDYRKMLNDLDELTEIAQELENQGENINSQLIFFPMLAKFPADIQAEVTPKLHSKKFDGTFERFQIEIEKAIRAQLIRTGGFTESSRLHQHRSTDMVIAQINAKAETPSNIKGKPKSDRQDSEKSNSCPFGDGEHKSTECSAKLEHKMKTIELGKRCINCLKRHSVEECPSKYRCKNCREKHHTAICEAFENGKAKFPFSKREFFRSQGNSGASRPPPQ